MEVDPEIFDAINNRIKQEEHIDPYCNWLPSLLESTAPLYLHPGYLNSRLPYFRTMLFNGGAISWPECQAASLSWYSTNPLRHFFNAHKGTKGLEITLKSVAKNLELEWIDFDEDLIGNPYYTRKHFFLGKPQTVTNIQNSFFYSLINKHVLNENISSIMDIGGGYGGLISKIAEKNNKLKLFLLEFPRNCLISYYYLKQKKFDVDILHKEPVFPQKEINILCPWILKTINTDLDAVVNTHSFQHMNQANHEYFFSHMKRLNVKIIFSVNRETATREGESPFLETAIKYGFRLTKRFSLLPWSDKSFLQIFQS